MKTSIRGASYRCESYFRGKLDETRRLSWRQPVDIYDDGESSFEAHFVTPRRARCLSVRLVLTEEIR
jgi:hypothetical protein